MPIQFRPQIPDPLNAGTHDGLGLESIRSRPRLQFLHPHYPPPSNEFLHLLASDEAESCSGLDYGVAHTACAILARNRWDGFLTDMAGRRLESVEVSIIPAGQYYFQVEGSTWDSPYPLVPSFRHWIFPHNNIPTFWNDCLPRVSVPISSSDMMRPSNFSAAVTTVNKSCRMTGFIEGTEAAHLCPRSELDWYRQNGMEFYDGNSNLPVRAAADTIANAVLLRRDLHWLFDSNMFVFAPKTGDANDVATKVVTHMLCASPEVAVQHHNVPIRPIDNVSPAFLLARFAWAIFQLPRNFWVSGIDRMTVIAGERAKMLSPDDYARLTTSSRSQSPAKKAKRGRPDNNNDSGSIIPSSSHPDDQGNGSSNEEGSPSEQSLMVLKSSPITSLSAHQTEVDQLSSLRQNWLNEERARSDPENSWAHDQAWAERVWKNEVVLGSETAERFLEICGMDSRES